MADIFYFCKAILRNGLISGYVTGIDQRLSGEFNRQFPFRMLYATHELLRCIQLAGYFGMKFNLCASPGQLPQNL